MRYRLPSHAEQHRYEREGVSTVNLNHPLMAEFRKHGVTPMRKLQYLFMTAAALLLAPAAFAQTAEGGKSGLFYIAAGLGMALAAGLCGLAQGKATASAAEALARNPGARPGIFTFLILGLAFIESLALFTFVIIFLKVQ
ncbi:ATP synthase F0 subunit C [Terriglobus albidus]